MFSCSQLSRLETQKLNFYGHEMRTNFTNTISFMLPFCLFLQVSADGAADSFLHIVPCLCQYYHLTNQINGCQGKHLATMIQRVSQNLNEKHARRQTVYEDSFQGVAGFDGEIHS